MKFCVQHAAGDPAWTPAILAPDAVTRFARAAEDGGFEGLAFTDHPAPSARWVASGGEGVADPFSALGFVAAVTERIRLMTWVLVASYRSPLAAAHQLATLDRLSAGRVTVGLGTGYLRSEFKALGADPDVRREVFDEAVALMKQAWTVEPVSFESPRGSAREVLVQPPPVQRPHPPLWIHGNGAWGTERAAAIGDGWIGMITGSNDVIVSTTRTTPIRDHDELARRIDDLRAATERHGRTIDEITIAATGMWPQIDTRLGWDRDAVLAEVAALEGLGVEWIVITCCGDDAGAAEESVARFAEEIVAPTRATTAVAS